MSDEGITDSKLYELATEAKKNMKERREDINKYYTSLFTAVVSIPAFIDKIPVKNCVPLSKYDTMHVLLCLLSIIALTLSFSWVLTLKRICNSIVAFDKFLMRIEEKYNKKFIIFTKEHLMRFTLPEWLPKMKWLYHICSL